MKGSQHCGAKTKKGGVCKALVKDGYIRCHRHREQSASIVAGIMKPNVGNTSGGDDYIEKKISPYMRLKLWAKRNLSL